MGKMTIFHDSYTSVEHPETRIVRNTKDFGPCFYCTVIREQAERWAKRYDTPVVSTYTIRMDTWLKILEFKEMTEEWLDFIVACSHGEPHNYDIIISARANDQIYTFIAGYKYHGIRPFLVVSSVNDIKEHPRVLFVKNASSCLVSNQTGGFCQTVDRAAFSTVFADICM